MQVLYADNETGYSLPSRIETKGSIGEITDGLQQATLGPEKKGERKEGLILALFLVCLVFLVCLFLVASASGSATAAATAHGFSLHLGQ